MPHCGNVNASANQASVTECVRYVPYATDRLRMTRSRAVRDRWRLEPSK